MQPQTVASECLHEFHRLRQVKDALRITLNWKAPAVGLSRKLSSVLFIIHALQRHLERQLALEENGGYLSSVDEAKPNLASRTERLRSDHDAIRDALRDLLPSMEKLTPADDEQFTYLCDEIVDLLKRIDRHDVEEAELLQEALLQDEGGEG